MIGQHGLRRTEEGPPIRYDALESCLEKLAGHARQRNAAVHMPKIGAGLAGGDWDRIESIVRRALAGVPTTVYVLP
ncbi:macro domain-containing protein [Lentzea terrae]|uniref:macro domain-containing protein n=1 Tax=Lentzea terrae TaxID=2200761 RepID=UPI000DD42180|nr:macro domain-containing protein [Lentzea terrae]